MDNGSIYNGITDFKVMQLYTEIKMMMADMTTKFTTIDKRLSERKGEELLDCNQVMNMLRIKKVTLQKYRDTQILPFVQVSGKIFYKTSDVEKLIQSNYNNRSRKKKSRLHSDHCSAKIN